MKADPQRTYYLRYAKEWSGGGIVMPRGPAALSEDISLELVAEEMGKARR